MKNNHIKKQSRFNSDFCDSENDGAICATIKNVR